MSPIISCLIKIPPNDPNVDHHGVKLKIFLLSNYMNRYLGLLSALKVKPFCNQRFFQWWHKKSHVPTLEHQPQINIVATLVDCPHNIQHDPVGIIANDGST